MSSLHMSGVLRDILCTYSSLVSDVSGVLLCFCLHEPIDDGTSVFEKIDQLSSFETTIFVHVKLVGFEEDGELHLSVTESDLLKYLKATPSSDPVHILHHRKADPQDLYIKFTSFQQQGEYVPAHCTHKMIRLGNKKKRAKFAYVVVKEDVYFK